MGPLLPGWRRFWIIEFLSRIRVGVCLLAAIVIYACIASALPQVRGALEMTEMQIFRHWLFGAMIFLFTLSLVLATLTRITPSVINAGVWTVHIGLLLLVGGSVWYFSSKIEGDALLVSPKVQIVSVGAGQSRVIGEVLAEPGQAWETVMPAFGGAMRVAVEEVTTSDPLRFAPGASAGEVTAAVLSVTMGGSEERIDIASGVDSDLSPGRLIARLAGGEAVDQFYDGDTAALYVRASDPDDVAAGVPDDVAAGVPAGRGTRENDDTEEALGSKTHYPPAPGDTVVLPIEGLPLYRERYLDDGSGEVLRDAAGRPAPSKRTRPGLDIAGLHIPTPWFEDWRLPIRVESDDLPFDVEVTGYVPYVSRMETTPVEGGAELNPAVHVRLALGETFIDESLFALDPVRSTMTRGLPVEFRWFESEEAMEAALEPLAGPNELYIEVKDPPMVQTLAVTAGQVIKLPGTSYELTVRDFQRTWPLMTPGFEGASSPMASVDVKCEGKSYSRTVIQRFPELSQDIDEEGVRHREGPYDPNLVLRYRTSAQGRVLIAAGPSVAAGVPAGRATPVLEPRVAVFDNSGAVKVTSLPPGTPRRVEMMGTPLDLTLRSFALRAVETLTPIIEPLERRRPNIAARSASAVRLKLTPREGGDQETVTRWCLFSQYPHVDANVLRVRPPGASCDYEIIYSRVARPLGATLVPRKLSVTFFPGRRNVESWRSDFLVREPDGATRPAAVYTNQTCAVGEWTLFQSGAAGDHWSYTIVGVGNRNGIWTMLLGCSLVTLGCLYAFYVKPVLIRRGTRKCELRIENGELRMMKDGGASAVSREFDEPCEEFAASEVPADEPEEVGA